MEKHHHRHHLKNLFRKDKDKDSSDSESRSSSHINLSKLFHKEKDQRSADTSSGNVQSQPPLVAHLRLQLRQLHRQLALAPHEGHVVGKVETTADGKVKIKPISTSVDNQSTTTAPVTPITGPSRVSSSHNAANPASAAAAASETDPSAKQPANENVIHRSLSRSSSDAGSHVAGNKLNSTPLAISLKRNNTNGMLASTRQSIRRAETLSHYGSRPPSSPLHGTPGRKHSHHDKIKYNPYGINKLDLNQTASHLTLFYLKGGPDLGGRVVANPVANPNDFLPEDLHEAHVNLLEDFEYENMDKKIGDGGSGDVRRVTLCANKKKHYALKKFSLFSKETDEEFYKRAAKEYIISRRVASLRHVVSTFALLRIQSHGNMTRGWGMVMEFCSGGDLFNMIVRLGWKRTPLVERYCIFKQIAYGVKFLHDHDIVHRDLKPENVLLDHNGLTKLCDFGVSDWGHEEPGNCDSPVKLSTAYVGSPPYSPPEVMALKDLSSSELKKHAYDPFKMDYWSLGMLLFCLVYSGVPFQQATVHDTNFRDYKFNRDRFCSDNPLFKNNAEFAKGPGSEFKWASLFQSGGAARVAWKLCDPSVERRYNLEHLFADPWFVGLEMCIYEHPDQSIDPIVYGSAHPSASSSAQPSRAPSRKNTITSHSPLEETPFNPIRSMLDMSSYNKEAEPSHENVIHDNDDNALIKSSSLLDHVPLKIKHEDRVNRSNSEFLINLVSLSGSIPRVRSMLESNTSSEKPALSRVAETDSQLGQKAKHSPLLGVLKEITSVSERDPESNEIEGFSLDKDTKVPQPIQSPQGVPASYFSKHQDIAEKLEQVSLFEDEELHTPEDMTIDTHGICDLGYKIKKHSHMDVSNVHYGSSLSRKK